MTSTISVPPKAKARVSALPRPVAMKLAAAEYQRFLDVLRQVPPDGWEHATDCPQWDVRAVAGHVLGMAEMSGSLMEQYRQMRPAMKGEVFIDALTALQVAKHRSTPPADLISRYASVTPKAAKGRRRTPSLVRNRTMPVQQSVNGVMEDWTFGFLIDVILTRDTWMHRLDITRAIGVEPYITAEHDGIIVADVVAEWAGRHGDPYSLGLRGAAGGTWTSGNAVVTGDYDSLDFCRALSGRGPRPDLLSVDVPF